MFQERRRIPFPSVPRPVQGEAKHEDQAEDTLDELDEFDELDAEDPLNPRIDH
jgi:hypothetical protein